MTTYTVTGPHIVLGHEPGATFEADLDAVFVARAVARGSLEVAGGLQSLTRDQLDELAADVHGVPDPAVLPNKDAVIAAINATQEGDE